MTNLNAKKLIVNADDFGHSTGTSQGICLGHLNGIITSTTAMMNYSTVIADLKKAIKDCPRLGLGVHLVLTSGKPLLPGEDIPCLVDNNGNFLDLSTLRNNLGRINIAEVESEWRAQIRAFRFAVNRKPDHLDSHHHISYASPALFELMIRLADELGCPVRVPFGTQGTVFADSNRGKVDQFRNVCAHFFFDNFYDQNTSLIQLSQIMHKIAGNKFHETFELMCHPAIVDDFLRRTSSYHERRADELTCLCSPEIKSLVKELGIELINFSELPSKAQQTN